MYDFLVWLQGFENPFLLGFFKVISEIITPIPLSAFAIIIYLAVNKKKGLRLAMTVLTTVIVNTGLKLIFRVERPFIADDRIKALDDTTGYSFPSGHTQEASGMSYAFFKDKKLYVRILTWVGITFLMAVSRMYLGMHSPLDVFVGAILGIVTAILVEIIVSLSEKKKNPYILYSITFVALIVMFASGLYDDVLVIAAISLGAVTGYIIEGKVISYKVPQTLGKRFLAGFLGVFILLGMKFLLSLIFPDIWYLRFLEYTLFGLTATLLAPFIIKKILDKIN